MNKKIDFQMIPDVKKTIAKEKKNTEQYPEEGDVVYISIPYDLKIGVAVNNFEHDILHGEIISIGGIAIEGVEPRLEKLSLSDKIEFNYNSLNQD